MFGGEKLFLDLMEIWYRFNFFSMILLSCPAILFTIGLVLFNKYWQKNHPKQKTKNEQIKGMRSCIKSLQADNEYYRELVNGLTKAYALKRIGGKQE